MKTPRPFRHLLGLLVSNTLGAALAGGLLLSSAVRADTMLSLAADCGITENAGGTIESLATANSYTGDSGADPWVNRCMVYVFQLPSLGNVANPFTEASLTFNYISKNGNPKNTNLYGLGRRASSTVLVGDYYGVTTTADPTDASMLQTSILTSSTAVGPITTSAGGNTALLTYLNAQYAAGAGAGQYVFLRFSTAGAKTGVARALLTLSEGGVAGPPDTRPRITYTYIATPPVDTIRVESAADGSANAAVPAQTLTVGESAPLTCYAISRDAGGGFVANDAATWSLVNVTGSIVAGDLVAAGDAKSATFTPHGVGTAEIHAIGNGINLVNSGTITVVAGAASQVRVETALDGSGTLVAAQNLQSTQTLTCYAITRDSGGNFLTNVPAIWSLANLTGGVVDGDLVAAGDGQSATFTAHGLGAANIRATVDLLTPVDSGLITVIRDLTWSGTGAAWDTTSNHWLIFDNSPFNFADGDRVAFTNTGTANPAVDLVGTLSPSSIAVSSSSVNYSLGGSGALAGACTLTKSGASTLTLSTANTYTGATVLSAGTLRATSNAGALGAGVLTLNGANAVLELANDTGLNFGRATTVSATPVTIKSDRLTSGAGPITHTLGGLSIGAQTLNVTPGANVTLDSAYGLTFGATTLSAGPCIVNVANNGTGIGTLTLGALTGNFGLTKQNSGTLVLNGTSTRSAGATTLTAGTLRLSTVAGLGTAATTLTLNGGILDLAVGATVNAHPTTVGGPVTILSNKAAAGVGITHTLGTLSIGAQTLSVAAGSNVNADSAYGLTFGATTLTAGPAVFSVSNNGTGAGTLKLGVVGGNFALTKSGTGNLSLAGVNTYTGNTKITDGKFVGVVGGSSANSTVQLFTAAATLGVSITDNTKQWTCAALECTAAGVLDFDFGATVAPSATVAPLKVNGTASFGTAPSVTVEGTYLTLGTFPLMTWGSIDIGSAPTAVTLPVGVSGHLAVAGTTLNLVITAIDFTKANNTTDLNLAGSWLGPIPGAADIARWDNTVTAANTTVLGADTTWAGIRLFNPAGPVTIQAGHVLTMGAAPIDIDLSLATADLTLNCPLVMNAAHVWDVANGRTLTSNGGMTGGTNTLTKQGAGTAILTGTNDYTGVTTINAGTLTLSGTDVVAAANVFNLGAGTLSLRDDTAGTIARGDLNILATGATLNVDNNGGTTTGTTVAFGHLAAPVVQAATNTTFTGANNYKVTFTGLSLSGGTGQGTTLTPTTTSVTIAGDVTNLLTAFTAHFDTLTLDGTSTGNSILGVIADSSGYTSVGNGDTRLTKSGTSTWTLAGISTYHGPTAINAGKLVGITGGSAANSTATLGAVSATLGVAITDNTQSWTYGNLTTTAAGVLEFDFGAIAPSATLAPLQIPGVAAFTVTPTVVIAGSNLSTGSYPLVTWGSTTDVAPTAILLPNGGVATLSVVGNTLYMNITATSNSKADNGFALNDPNSWTALAVPAVFDIARWDFTVTAANTTVLGADTIWAGIKILDPVGLVTLDPGNTLTLGAAAIDIDMAAATADLTLNCPLVLGAVNVWDVAAGRTLTLSDVVSGTVGITKQGAGAAVLTGANSNTGALTVNEGSLTLSGARPAAAAGAINLNNASTLNISDGVFDLSGDSRVANSAILNLSGGTLNNTTKSLFVGSGTPGQAALIDQTGGSVIFTTGPLNMGNGLGNGNTGTYNLSNGTLSFTTGMIRMGTNGGTVGVPTISHFNLSNTGILQIPGTLGIGRSDGATVYTDNVFTQTGGTATVGTLHMGGQAATSTNTNATLTLTGGTFTATTFSKLALGDANTAAITIGGTADVTLPAFPTARGAGATATLTLDGGTLKPAAASATYLSGLTSAVLTTNGAKFHVATGNDITVAQVLANAPAQAGTLTKSGPGKLTLTGTNTYSGITTVTEGTLGVGGNSIANANPLVIDGGKVEVAAAGETVDTLYFGAEQKAAGTYGSESSLADYRSDTYFSGSGILTVNSGPATDYSSWWKKYPSITNAADKLPGADADHDGLTNQQEYAFGLDPSLGSSVSPIIVQLDKATGTFTYTRRNPSLTGLVSYRIWTSSTLAADSWDEDLTANQSPTDVDENQHVVVTLSEALRGAPRLFVRVTAE